jgi:hypothetical protein
MLFNNNTQVNLSTKGHHVMSKKKLYDTFDHFDVCENLNHTFEHRITKVPDRKDLIVGTQAQA